MAECRGERLPKYTIEVARVMDAPAAAEGVARYRAMWQAVAKVYRPEWLEEQLDGRSFEDVDLAELARLYDETRSAYGAGPRESSARAVAEALEVLDAIPVDRIQKLGEAMREIYAADERAKGFKRVV